MPMTCSQATELGTRAVSGNASASDQAELETHLAGCAPCRDRQARWVKLWGLMGRAPEIAGAPDRMLEVSRRIGSGPARRRLWGVGLAAAALVGVAILIITRPTPPVPGDVSVVPAPLPKPVLPEEPRPEPAPREIERHQLEQLLEQDRPATPAPDPKGLEKSDPPAPRPADRKPEPPVAPAPEPKPLARPENPEAPPAPPQNPAPVPAPTALPAGTLDRAEGSVLVVLSGTRSPARSGQPIPEGAGLETVGAGSRAVLEYADGSRVALGGDTIVLEVSERRAPAGKPAEGKLIQLVQGVIAAQVVRQPAGEPMIFLTPQAEAKVLGTRLSLSIVGLTTRLEVRQGRVKFSRRDDGLSAEITEGHYAVAGKGVAPTPRPAPSARVILHETFDHGKWSSELVQGGDATSGLRFSTETGSLALLMAQKAPPEIAPTVAAPGSSGVKLQPADVAKKAIDSMSRNAALGAKGELPRALWLETRHTYALSNETPLRLRARLWHSNADPDRSSWMTVNRPLAGQALSLLRRGNTLDLWSEAGQATLLSKDLPSVQEWEVLELWLTKDQVVVRRNDRTIHTGPNPLKTKVVQLSFGGNAKAELTQEGEVRFDDIQLTWMTKADFEDVSR